MPQLMPIYWCFSIFMMFCVILVAFMIFYESDEIWDLMLNMNVNSINWKW